jgi:uncharacterized protein (UPF0332 family)
MKSQTLAFLGKSERVLVAAKNLLADGDCEFAAGRAYYALFYAAQALLCERGLRFRKHSGVHSAFGEKLVKTGELDPKFHRWLLAAFEMRIIGDYGVEAEFTNEEVEETIERAEEFLRAARQLLERADS